MSANTPERDAEELKNSASQELATFEHQMSPYDYAHKDAVRKYITALISQRDKALARAEQAEAERDKAHAAVKRVQAAAKQFEISFRKTHAPDNETVRKACIANATLESERDMNAALTEEIETLRAKLTEVPEPVYKSVERILDEESAWVARPNDEVTKRIALRATIAGQHILEQIAKDSPSPQPQEPVGLEIVGIVLTEEQMGISFDRRYGPIIWFGGHPKGGSKLYASLSPIGEKL